MFKTEAIHSMDTVTVLDAWGENVKADEDRHYKGIVDEDKSIQADCHESLCNVDGRRNL